MKPKKQVTTEQLPLRDVVKKIILKGGVSQNDMERALGHPMGYIAQQKTREKNGAPYSKLLIEKLEQKYEYVLTGKKSFEMDEQEYRNRSADQITLLRSQMEVLLTEVASLIDPKNVSKKKAELARTAREAVEDQLLIK